MAQRFLIEELLTSLPRSVLSSILREAGIAANDQYVLENGAVRFRGHELAAHQIPPLILPLLRSVQLSDEQFKQLAAESGIGLTTADLPTQVRLNVPYHTAVRDRKGIPITELATASLMVWELSLRVGQVVGYVDATQSLDPPEIQVESGSVGFSFNSPTLLVAGLGFIVASHAAIPVGMAAALAFYGGSLVFGLGISDWILDWYKRLQEAQKLKSDRDLNEASIPLKELEIQKAQLEIQKMQRELQPPAALVPAETVKQEARRFGITPELATHLTNRVLPTYVQLCSTYPAPIAVSSSRVQAAVSAAAGR